MLELNSEQAAAELAAAERIPLFSIDGTVYSVPKQIDGGSLLRYLDDAAERGGEAAIANLLREMVGDDGYEALVSFKGLKPGQLEELFDKVEEYAMGQMNKIGGKSRRRSWRR